MVHVEYVLARYTLENYIRSLLTKNNNCQVCFSLIFIHSVTFLKIPKTLVTKVSAEFI